MVLDNSKIVSSNTDKRITVGADSTWLQDQSAVNNFNVVGAGMTVFIGLAALALTMIFISYKK